MGRSQYNPKDHQREHDALGVDFSKKRLMEVSQLSSKTFDMIRKAARVKGPAHGGLDWQFSLADLHALIHTASGGKFTERGAPAAEAWRAMLEAEGLPTSEPKGPSGR
jgi:hypothetical protein